MQIYHMCRIPNGKTGVSCVLFVHWVCTAIPPSVLQILCNAVQILCKYYSMLRKIGGIAVQTQCTNKTQDTPVFPFGILHIWYICKHASCKKSFCRRNSRNCCYAGKGAAHIDPEALWDWHNKAIQNLERCRCCRTETSYRTNPKQAGHNRNRAGHNRNRVN